MGTPRAMVMAAGLGTRLRPLTWEIPKPIVPVGNRPVIEHLLVLLRNHGINEVIANTHWFPEQVEAAVGDGSWAGVELSYRHEEDLLGTAGGVRNVADFLTGGDDDTFVVMAGDALTDVDLSALIEAHRANDGLATLAVKPVDDVSQYGVIVTDSEGRIEGFQEKPDPAEALSNLSNCMIYAFSAEIFDHFPEGDPIDFAMDVFPALLDSGQRFYVHEIDAYWNDVGSLPEFLTGNLDVVTGEVALGKVGGTFIGDAAEGGSEPETTGAAPDLPDDLELEGRVLIGEGVEIGPGVRLDGPLLIGDGCRIGDGAKVKESVLLPGSEVAADGLVARSIVGSGAGLRAG